MSIEALNTSDDAKLQRFNDFANHKSKRPEITPPPLFSCIFEDAPSAEALQDVRHRICLALGVDAMSLIGIGASELLTNGFTHSQLKRVAVGRANSGDQPAIVVEVSDTGEPPLQDDQPFRSAADEALEGGLGLPFIGSITDHYGREDHTSWFALPQDQIAA